MFYSAKKVQGFNINVVYGEHILSSSLIIEISVYIFYAEQEA